MAEHNMQISLSSSSNDSSDQETPFTTAMNPTTDTGGSSHQQTPTDSPQPSRKPRGRPPGSKNKPKPPIVITQDNEQAMKPAIIEVAAGTDVLEAVIQFAVRLGSCLTILSGSGTVSVATLHYPVCQSPAFTLHGPFSLLTLTGTFFFPPSPPPPPPLPISLPIASSSSNPNPNQLDQPPTPTSTFGITLAGMQGQIFGGIIGGKIIAGGNGVKIVASLFKNPELHRAAGILLEADDDDFADDDNGGGNGGGDAGAGSSGAAAENVTGFNVPPPHSDPNFMPWNHPSHPRPPNF
ncbi:AT-hook motif nuclear-localized protein 28-like [Vicia villosa]|uniref:AT-hook motif nuclear-localized protein 28-like n=1 Tax=Vicia villosa TaxID=3911 RepID=UPI00273BFAF8|nr:AT-hook motif nuclear-localized protein 28-like [Vicia villosa]